MLANETGLTVVAMIDTEKFAKELGARIAAYRREQSLSQTQLGGLVGQSQQVVADYETGRRRIPACNVAAIADALGISVAALIDGTTQRKSRRGPASRIDQLAEQVSKLPRSRQKFVVEMIENALLVR